MLPSGSFSNQVRPRSPRLEGNRMHISASFRRYTAITWRKWLKWV
ncbi:hypothetical protein LOK49_LG10G01518 [Camellia lanceoleosa]|uniref:Uncharacterized protein n=1 Tax=Camellia lanceoleosa TaxID=1840588 RepID=A0ACC0GE34_9ERIC|nr:hypothetical protein LOK49_LG10G01518 [Camellia lanceoleosa]